MTPARAIAVVLITAGFLLQGPDGGVANKHTVAILIGMALALAAITAWAWTRKGGAR